MWGAERAKIPAERGNVAVRRTRPTSRRCRALVERKAPRQGRGAPIHHDGHAVATSCERDVEFGTALGLQLGRGVDQPLLPPPVVILSRNCIGLTLAK
jgi:hypothetical protein